MSEEEEQLAASLGGADHARRQRIYQAVRAMPRLVRLALVLKHVEGMSFAEIAVSLELTEEQARRNYHSGLQRIDTSP